MRDDILKPFALAVIPIVGWCVIRLVTVVARRLEGGAASSAAREAEAAPLPVGRERP